MDTKKDVGQFFNDRFSQMDFTPNEEGWNKIEKELKEKKRKKRALFWMFFGAFLSGSLLTLLIVFSNNLLQPNSDNNNNNNTTDSESIVRSTKEVINTNSEPKNKETNKNSETNFSNKGNHKNEVTKNNSFIENNKNYVVSSKNNISNQQKQHKKNKSISNKNYTKNNINYSSNYKIATTKIKNKSYRNQKIKNSSFKVKSTAKNYTKISSNLKNHFSENKDNATILDKNLVDKTSISNDSTKIENNTLIVKDTAIIAEIAKKPIKKTEKLLEKDATEVIAKNKSNTFIFSPYLGYGLLNKNQITGAFNATNNIKVSNEHYGFTLRWMANKKIGIQIGLGYIDASTKTEIEKTNSNNLYFNGIQNNLVITYPASNKLIMSHDFSMYEIPLEFYYKVIDKKIGLAFTSGISHTILKNNDVYIETSQGKMKAGSLQNISDNSFNANLKIYGSYKISNKIQFELYPSFQYQFINSIQNKDLNPFIISLRAGVSYQF